MKFDFYKIMMTIFYISTMVCIIAFMLNTNWSADSIEILSNLGIVGGLFYWSNLFRKEMDDAYHATDENSQQIKKLGTANE